MLDNHKNIIKELYSIDEDCALCYASCNRCVNYIDESSSIFGEAFYCSVENSPHSVYDNDWHFETGETIIDCEYFKIGNPTHVSEIKKDIKP
jgi:hypothetical protein